MLGNSIGELLKQILYNVEKMLAYVTYINIFCHASKCMYSIHPNITCIYHENASMLSLSWLQHYFKLV